MAVIEPKYYEVNCTNKVVFSMFLVTKSLFSNFLGITPRQKKPSPTWMSNMKTSLENGWTKI